MPAIAPTPATSLQTMSENPVQDAVDENTQPKTPKMSTTGKQSDIPTNNSPSAAPVTPASEVKASPALVEKFEQGSGENKINVRIFKEPTTKPVITEPQKDAETKRVDGDTLVVRLKKDFHATPVRPTAPDRRSKRIIILEE